MLNNCFNVVSTRSSDNNFFSAPPLRCFSAASFLAKKPSFKNDFSTPSVAVDLLSGLFSAETLTNTVNFESTFFNFNSTPSKRLSCVSYQQVCKHNCGSEVLLMRVFSTPSTLDTTESKTTDTSETVNTNFNYHISDFLLMKIMKFLL